MTKINRHTKVPTTHERYQQYLHKKDSHVRKHTKHTIDTKKETTEKRERMSASFQKENVLCFQGKNLHSTTVQKNLKS